jgi:hypothetical protein
MQTLRTLALTGILLTSACACGTKQQRTVSQQGLAGSTFRVALVPSGQAAMDDTLIFTPESFESTVCTKAGFSPAPYSTQVESDGRVTFTASCDSETYGHNDWRGTVVGDHIEGSCVRTPKSGGEPVRSTFSGDRAR